MNDFQKSVLNALIDKYEKSVLSKEGSERDISIKLDSKDSALKKYDAIDSYKYSEQYNQDIKELDSLGYIHGIFNKFDKFQSLLLNLDCVDNIYRILQRENPKTKCEEYISFLNSYECTGFLKEYVQSIVDKIKCTYRVPKTLPPIEEMKNVLDIVQLMGKQDEEIMERDFSIKYLGDSKIFATLKSRACKIISENDPEYPYSDEEFDVDRILSYYNITKNSSTALIKNNLCFKVHNQVIDLNSFGHIFYLSDEAIKDMQMLDSDFKKVITVENLTTFKQYQDDDAVIIYLAGFNNHTKQMLLKKIYEKYPGMEYFHFSDIDCGGFLIFNHLVESTGIPFKPLHMSVEDMNDSDIVLKPLTLNDVARLKKMSADPRFKQFWPVISYMLIVGKKLEQEALDHILCDKK